MTPLPHRLHALLTDAYRDRPPAYDAIDGAVTYDPAANGIDEDDEPVTYWPRWLGPHIPQPRHPDGGLGADLDADLDTHLYPPS